MKTNRKRPTSLEPISAAVFVIVSLHLAAVFGVWHWWQNLSNARLQARTAQQLAWMNPADFAPPLPPPAAVPRAIALSPSAAAAAARALKKSPATPPAKPAAAVPPTKSAPMALTPPVNEDPPVQKATLIAGPPQQHVMEPVPNPAVTSGNPATPGSSTAAAMAPAPLFAGAALAPKPSANRSITLRRAPDKRTGTPTFGTPAPPMTSPTLMDIARLNALRPSAVPPPDATAPPAPEVNLDAVDEAVNADFLAGWVAPPIDGVPEGQREGRLNISIGKDGTVLKAQMSKFSGSHVLDQSILEAASKVKKISTTLPSNFAKDSYDLELNFMLLP